MNTASEKWHHGVTRYQRWRSSLKQKRKTRMGRNPATGASIKIAAKTVVKFRLAKAANDAVLGVKQMRSSVF
jgi:hypothetical protein